MTEMFSFVYASHTVHVYVCSTPLYIHTDIMSAYCTNTGHQFQIYIYILVTNLLM